MASLKAKLFASASVNAGLQAFLLNGSVFQWGDVQLAQAWDLTNHSAVAVFQVSKPKDYTANGPMYTAWVRMQFTIYGHGNDSQNAEAVAEALFAWLLSITTLTLGQTPNNYVVGDKDAGIAATQPLTYMRIIDVMMLVDDST
jgi:hypothetical protein